MSLIARANEGIKQWGASAMAVEIAARRIRDLHVVAASYDVHRRGNLHCRRLEAAGIPVVEMPWGSWESYMARVSQCVDAHLTATLSESYCLVPLEHCLMGRPVAGTPAVEWLPREWQGNPQDPASLADILVNLLDPARRREHAGRARAAAQAACDASHAGLLASLRRLLAS